MWLSTVGLNNLVKGILFFSSLGLFTNTATGSRPAQLFVQAYVFLPALSSFFLSHPASSFLCSCHPSPLLFRFLLIFFFSLSSICFAALGCRWVRLAIFSGLWLLPSVFSELLQVPFVPLPPGPTLFSSPPHPQAAFLGVPSSMCNYL